MRYPIKYERQELFDVNMIITMIFKIDKEFSETAIKDAFDKAVGVNEILNTAIKIEEDGSAFYEGPVEPGSSITVTEGDFETIRKAEEKKRFHLEEGEYIRAFAKPEGGKTQIMLLVHHMAGDGESSLYFIEDFLTFLSGGEKQFKKIRTVETKPFVSPKLKAFLSNAVSKSYNKKWSNKVFTFEDMQKAYDNYWKDKTTDIEIEIIEKDEMDEILSECRKVGAKFTAYLTAKLIKDDAGVKEIGYAVNYRHDGNRSMGNQASGISIKHKYNCSKSIYENAAAIQKEFSKRIEEDKEASYVLNFMSSLKPTLVDAVNLIPSGLYDDKVADSLAGIMGFKGKTSDYSVTNLTKADIPSVYGDFKIEELMFAGPVVSYCKNVISVVTCNNKTVIATHRIRNL